MSEHPFILNTADPFSPLDREEELHLWPLAVHAAHLVRALRYVDYESGKADAALLAGRLQERFTPGELQEMAFAAVPRGGLFVLGWLAYLLDLDPGQLEPQFARSARRLCLVDDCALSGLRLSQQIKRHVNEQLVVALLYATDGLPAGAQAYDGRVKTVVCAHTLQAQHPGTDIRLQPGRLCAGPAHALAFAWNEPDFLVQLPFEDRPQPHWRFLPPHRCLGNRGALGLPPRSAVDRQWYVPDGIVYGLSEETLYLLDTENGRPYRLDGPFAGIWLAAAGYGDWEAMRGYLWERYPALTQEQLKAALNTLAGHGLLNTVIG